MIETPNIRKKTSKRTATYGIWLNDLELSVQTYGNEIAVMNIVQTLLLQIYNLRSGRLVVAICI